MTSRSELSRELHAIQKPASIDGRLPMISDEPSEIQRSDESLTEILRRRGGPIVDPGKSILMPEEGGQRLTKLLLNVTIQRSLGPVQVVISPENTVADLIKAALLIYVKEKRRPLLTETDPLSFELHYSQFSLESLNTKEKLINLGSRNFFLCPKPTNSVNSLCSDEAKVANCSFPLTKLMDFLL
ncbi:hypothetical protein HHK36_027911 [Tetracentron sinense]|uniref:DUF7054 domain-containing protein n=1 Tax=Tetracentron sinense TaxID=13715 RepID=A0A835D1Z4_TETSI|nr:hypothetical protein HHK36_027911 [Tetracentron sinense]